MHLTKAQLRRGSGRAGALAAQLLDAAERDQAHRLVWTLFSENGEEERDFLYRQIDPGEFLLLSRRAPQDPAGLWHLATRDFEPRFLPGERLSFILRANPAQVTRSPGKQRGVRVDAVMHAKRPKDERSDARFGPAESERAALAWLFKREERLGVRFDRDACQLDGYRTERLTSGFRRRADDTRFAVADFRGALEVTNPDGLSTAIVAGIGKAKAYGCGLLLVKPA